MSMSNTVMYNYNALSSKDCLAVSTVESIEGTIALSSVIFSSLSKLMTSLKSKSPDSAGASSCGRLSV